MKLAETLVRELIEKGLKIAFAESCTGGMLTSSVVDIPDASKVLYEGVVTYSNEAKAARLGVSEKTLEAFGAVSGETAAEMAEGLLKNADIGVATTGIAGPSGGTPEKPVGLVYIAVSGKNGTVVIKNNFGGDRKAVRTKTRNKALKEALGYIRRLK